MTFDEWYDITFYILIGIVILVYTAMGLLLIFCIVDGFINKPFNKNSFKPVYKTNMAQMQKELYDFTDSDECAVGGNSGAKNEN